MTTIKVSEKVRDHIKAIGAPEGLSANDVLERLLEEHERAAQWEAYRAAVAADQAGPDPDWTLWERASLADGASRAR